MARPPSPVVAPLVGDEDQKNAYLADAITQNQIAISTMRYGVQNGSNARPGEIGEYVSVAVTTPVTLTANGTIDLTTMQLTAGDWDVVGEAYFQASSSAGTDQLRVWTNTVSVTQISGDQGGLAIESTSSGGQINNLTCSPWRLNITATTTVYLSVYANFGAGTMTVKGFVRARRMR
jgi:hypothetical protein